ncbi:MAG: MlaA family lipoprotein [Sphingobium sp.]|nr:MlaA family lipoprotein [Sphingobium sp.]MCI2052772.1 MlaA family lipoprotein [Sphingobium sp.]
MLAGMAGADPVSQNAVEAPGIADAMSQPQSAEQPAPTAPPSVQPPQIVSPAVPPAKAPGAAQGSGADSNVIVVTGDQSTRKQDPAQAINQVSYEAVQALDKAIVGPVARTYKKETPKPVRSAIRNVINNLDEPIVFVNFLLQLKPGKALRTVGRFAVNSTVGIAGIMDVAKKKPFHMPRLSNGLADTLGYYGVGPGPYLFLPLIGSTTVRDVFGRMLDLSLVPAAAGSPFNTPYYALPKGGLSALDERANNDEEFRQIRESGNPYAAQRTWYLNRRKAEILALHSQEYRDKVAAEEKAKAEAKEKARIEREAAEKATAGATAPSTAPLSASSPADAPPPVLPAAPGAVPPQ